MPSCSSAAANSTSLVSDASTVLPSVPGYLEAREDFVDGSVWFLPAAPSLLGGIMGEFWSDLPVLRSTREAEVPVGCIGLVKVMRLMSILEFVSCSSSPLSLESQVCR